MLGTSGNVVRPVGVSTGQNQNTVTTGAPKTLQFVGELQMFAVRYADETGTLHETVLTRLNDSWYMAPNGESYVRSLRPIRSDSWLAKLVSEQLEKQSKQTTGPVEVPKEDGVDIIEG